MDSEVVSGINFLVSYSPEDNKRFTLYDYSMLDTIKKGGKKKKKKKKKKDKKPYQGGQDIFLEHAFDRLFMNKGAKNYTELFVALSDSCQEKGN